jgi:hypothetical protein
MEKELNLMIFLTSIHSFAESPSGEVGHSKVIIMESAEQKRDFHLHHPRLTDEYSI